MRRTLKWTAIVAAALATVIVCAVVAGRYWLASDSGRAFLADQAAAVGVVIDSMSGDPFDRLSVASIVVRDEAGPWLSIENAALEWRPLALLSRRLAVDSLTADRIDVLRAPAGSDEPSDEASGFDIQPPPIDIEIRRIAVREIALAKELAGVPARIGLDAMAELASGTASLRLTLDRLDGPGTLALDAAYDLSTDRFDLDLKASEPAGGVATAILGLADGVELRLDGAGDLGAWNGRLTGRSGTAELADVALAIARHDDDIRLTAKGEVKPLPLLPDDARASAASFIGDTAQLDLSAVVKTDASLITLDRLRIDVAAVGILAAGRFQPESGEIDAEVATERLDMQALAQVAPDLAVAAPRIALQVEGTVAAPNARLRVETARIDAGGASASEVLLTATARPTGGESFEWQARLDVGGVRLGQADIDPIIDGPWSIEAGGEFDAASNRQPANIVLAGAAGASGSFDGAWSTSGAVEGRFDAQVEDLRPFAPLAGVPLEGPAAVSALLTYGEDGLDAREIKIEGEGATVAGDLALDAGFNRIDGGFRLTAADLARIGRLLDAPIAGRLEGEVKLSGDLADPASAGTFRFPRLIAAGQTFDRAVVTYKADNLATGPSGSVSAEAGSPYGRIAAAAGFAMQGDRLRLDRLTAQAPGARANGTLTVDLASGLATGEIAVGLDDLAATGRPFGLDLAGVGDGRVRLDARKNGVQGIDGRLDLRNLAGFGADVAALRVAANGGLGGSARLQATVQAERARIGDAAFERVTFSAEGPLARLALKLEAAGDAAGTPVRLDLQGQAVIADAGQRFRLSRGQGEIGGETFTLAEGLEIRHEAERLSVSGLSLRSEDVELDAALALDGARIDLDLRRANVDLTGLAEQLPQLPLGGTVTAAGRLRGPIARPEGRITLAGRDLQGRNLPDGPVFSMDGVIALANNVLRLDFTGDGLGPTPLRIDGSVGLASDGDGPPLPGPASPLDLRIAWTVPLAPVVALAPIDGHHLTGQGVIDLAFGGTVGAPDVRGTVSLQDGRYENLDFGTTLAFARIDIRANGRTIELAPFTARAGEGALSASGQATLDPAANFPFAFEAKLNNARLAARDDVSANASGDIRVEGGAKGMDVFARIVTDVVEIELIDNLPASIPRLDVTEIGAQPAGRPQPEPEEETTGPPIALDVQVTIPSRFFVRGRGLDSEWAGEITVTGTADQPIVGGGLDLKRGFFDLVGKRLRLTEGSVRLEPDASDRLEAVVDVLAEFNGPDFSVAARVSGPATDPKLDVSSNPDLPRDEILSRLLFNKNAGALTALESLQLAAAVTSMTSDGGGFDPVGDLRRATGIDTLSIGASEDGPTVEAGKYLTEDIYLGVRQGTSEGRDAITVEVEIFDSVTLESESLDDGSQKIGARLKWDY